MPAKKPQAREHLQYHKDGTLWAKLRSGFFESGKQVGQWTTNDAKVHAHKVTTI